jgi:hypothetical protein
LSLQSRCSTTWATPPALPEVFKFQFFHRKPPAFGQLHILFSWGVGRAAQAVMEVAALSFCSRTLILPVFSSVWGQRCPVFLLLWHISKE